jgi:hypothetical protein
VPLKVRLSDLLDGRLERFGVYDQMAEVTSDQQKCLTDGHNFLWVYADDEGFVRSLTRNAGNGTPREILRAISEAFDTEIFSEHEPQFWGFDTQKEWDAWQDAFSKEHEDKFYADILKFVAALEFDPIARAKPKALQLDGSTFRRDPPTILTM